MKIKHSNFIKIATMVLIDATALIAIACFALALRFDFHRVLIPNYLIETLSRLMVIIVVIKITMFLSFRLYTSVWKFASITELFNVVVASIIAEACINLMSLFFKTFLPASFYIADLMLTMAIIGGLRLAYRFKIKFSLLVPHRASKSERVMLIGAGSMGILMLEELRNEKYQYGKPVVFVDDDPAKIGNSIRGIKIAGSSEKIPELVKKYCVDKVIFCIPSASLETKKEILHTALETGLRVKVAQSIHGSLTNNPEKNQLRDVDVADLLARPVINLEAADCSYINGQVVLITGGGGSIGSEICRQVARFHPKQIVIFDIYENNAFELQNELRDKYGAEIDIQTRIGSVRDIKRLEQIFMEFWPNVVFHAAAHKHVPLMEDSPCEAVKNNVIGTLNTVKVARDFHVNRFILLSTDKAVNPTSVMGATKRVTEMIIQAFTWYNKTIFAAVRFGNVLGSSGSVIPTFKKQIEKGGPITVTHPDITRYFMTIPEASQLVIQAGGLAQGGEVFVLDMGEPVKIVDLAHNLIKMSGLVPDVDIKIVYTGLRPGEKLFEELSYKEEEDKKTTINSKIFITPPINFDTKTFRWQLDILMKYAEDGNAAGVPEALDQIIYTCIDHHKAENFQSA